MKKRILAYGRLNDDQLAQLGQDFEVQTWPQPTTRPSVQRCPTLTG
ncbi:hypothetical protein [Halomonas daqiaonensis]|uniref:Uncharacterized protein n=1 Tax=Halomonas daqiaonensis TaxID=650850 RepID=A0A1H7J9P9_9GAMM|nr:hypothetical protein [Halomonas daqiaonensis]SEK71443.1 hypothetical protein SAMN04488129_10411 [Halomonas daqiaonensis]